MQPQTVQTYQAQVKRITWLGAICNVLLAALKIALGKLGASQALLADGIHSLTDLLTDLAVLWGANFWSEPADEKHPYGHSKLEALVTFLIGGALFAVGVRMLVSSALSFQEPSLRFSWYLVLAAGLSVVLKEILYRVTLRKGTRLNSPALCANAWHHRSDALSSLPVLGVLLLGRVAPEWTFLDGLGGLLVSLMILYAAWQILRPAFDALVDRGLAPEKLAEVRAVALAIPGVDCVHALRSRVNGITVFLDMHILVDKDMTVYNGHKLAHRVRDEIVGRCGVTDVLVHVEPFTDEEKEETC